MQLLGHYLLEQCQEVENENGGDGGIYASAGPLMIASFLEAVTMVVIWRMLSMSVQNDLLGWFMDISTRVPSREYAVKQAEEGHRNQSDEGQVCDDNDGNVYREEEEFLE